MTLQIISLNLSIKNVWLYVSNVISNVEHCGHTVVVNKTLWIGFVVGIKGIGSCQHGNASIDLDQEANIKNRMKTRSASRRQYARYPRRYELSNLKH